MFETLAALGCCGGSLIVGLLAVAALMSLRYHRRSQAERARAAELAMGLGLRALPHQTWWGCVEGREVALRFVRGGDLSRSDVSPSRLRWRLQVVVACAYPAIGGECYARRPWRRGRSFEAGFSCLPRPAAHLDDAVRAALVALVDRTLGRAELLEGERASIVREALGDASMGVAVELGLRGLDEEELTTTLAELRAIAGALEARRG